MAVKRKRNVCRKWRPRQRACGGNWKTRRLAVQLIREAIRAGKQDGFRVFDLYPTRTAQFVGVCGGGALDVALAAGAIERVSEGRQWRYRVTDTGRAVARTGKLPIKYEDWWGEETLPRLWTLVRCRSLES